MKKSFTHEGKRYYVTADTQEELIDKIVRKKMELESGVRQISKNMLTRDWIDEWCKVYKEPSISAKWYKDLVRICNSVINPEIGNIPISKVKPTHLQQILNRYSDKSRSYLKKIYDILKGIFKTAYMNDLVIKNPSEPLILPTGRKPTPRRSFTKDERKYLLQAITGHWGELFLKIQLYCGLRPGEAAALVWADIDFKNSSINVAKAMKDDGSIGEPKTASGYRKVPVPSHFLNELKSKKGKPFDYVCTNFHGDKLTKNSIRRLWLTVVRLMNIEAGCRTFRGALVPPLPISEDLVMYDLRHTYCTDLQAAGVPINVARELMGHSDISTTALIYTHQSEESFEDARKKLDELQLKRAE